MKLLPIVFLCWLATGCASMRLSEKDFPELAGKPQGTLTIEIPDGKSIDGYDEKWDVFVELNGRVIARKAEFSDKEVYKIPVAAGSSEITVGLTRSVLRPFRAGYSYWHVNFVPMKIDFADKKNVTMRFALPEKSLRVGTLIIGIILPIGAIIGWPSGFWPEKRSEMTVELVR